MPTRTVAVNSAAAEAQQRERDIAITHLWGARFPYDYGKYDLYASFRTMAKLNPAM